MESKLWIALWRTYPVPLNEMAPEFRMQRPDGTSSLYQTKRRLISHSDQCVRRMLSPYAQVIQLAERQCQSSDWLRKLAKLPYYPRVRCQLNET